MPTPAEPLVVCLPGELPAQGGGGFGFLRQFRAYLDRHGIRWTQRVRDRAPVLFCNSWQTPPRTMLLAALLRPDVTIVHRVDGAAQDYGRTDGIDRRLARVNRLADITIFQSRYARWATREQWGVITHDGPVISNPVDLTRFSPDGERAPLASWPGPRLAVVNWSTNRLKGWPEVYAAAWRQPGVQFVLCGRFPEPPMLPNLVVAGVLEPDALAAHLRACDALLTFAQHEACPNHVLEAMACGLPVLHLNSGAMREVVAGPALEIDGPDLKAALDLLQAGQRAHAAQSRKVAEREHAPEVIFPQYLMVMNRGRRAGDPPTRVLSLLRKLRAPMRMGDAMVHGRPHDARTAWDHERW